MLKYCNGGILDLMVKLAICRLNKTCDVQLIKPKQRILTTECRMYSINIVGYSEFRFNELKRVGCPCTFITSHDYMYNERYHEVEK